MAKAVSEKDGMWAIPVGVLFEGTTAQAVLRKCSAKTRAYWKKHATNRNGIFYVKKTAFTGGPGKHLPDDFVDAWHTLVMGTKGCQSISLGRAIISNHHLRALARKHMKAKV